MINIKKKGIFVMNNKPTNTTFIHRQNNLMFGFKNVSFNC